MKLDRTIFKAYDIRGVYPQQINVEVVKATIPAILKALGLKNPPAGRQGVKTLIVSHDARLSGPELYSACIGALEQEKGVRVIRAGLLTTPMLYFLVNKKQADGGIMVTASHNPKEYNGLKVVREHAIPVSGMEVLKYIK